MYKYEIMFYDRLSRIWLTDKARNKVGAYLIGWFTMFTYEQIYNFTIKKI